MESNTELKHIPLEQLHIDLGGKMVPFAGYLMPVRYSSDLEEHFAVRNSVGVFDVSHMGEFLVEGPGALNLIQKVTTNDASVLKPGKAQYSAFPNETGGLVDDLLVYNLAEEKYMLVVNASNIEKDWNWISRWNEKHVKLTNISDEICLFAVQGPLAVKVLQKLTDIDLSAISYYSFTTGTMAGIKDVIISATGYTGAGGFELYVNKDQALRLWKEIFKAGQEVNIRPIGLGARDTLRLEMGFSLYGNDIDDTTSPIEAGLGWITKFSKPFIGDAIIKSHKENGIKRKLIGFELEERGIPRSHYEILNEAGEKLGEVTSGTQSPVLQKGIGMGYVDSEKLKDSATIYINIRNKPHKARIVKVPFLKK
jgi:aminomethyltransferase